MGKPWRSWPSSQLGGFHFSGKLSIHPALSRVFFWVGMLDELFEYLDRHDLNAIHENQLQRYGGAEGVLDENVVESALAAPRWLARFGEVDIADVASAYLFHFATTQGFRDGNKRTALAVMRIFLSRNGYGLSLSNTEMYDLTIGISRGEIDQQMAADQIRAALIPSE